MKILYLHSSSDTYGSSKILLDVINVAKRFGHECIVILPEDGYLINELIKFNVRTYIKDTGILRRKYLTSFGLINRFLKIITSQCYLRKVIINENIDIIYSNTTAVIAGALISRFLNKKHIWHIHEILLKPVFAVNLIAKLIDRFSDKAIVVSEEVNKHWQNYGVSNSKLITIYNGINSELFNLTKSNVRENLGIANNTIVIGMIARVHHWKGQDYFLEIAGRLVKEWHDVKFIMVGDVFPGYEYLYEKLDKIKTKFSLNDYVFDLGFRKDIPEVLQSFDIFVLPSILPDPLPTTVLEAMSAGKVVVATNHGGAVEMIDEGKSGFLVPYNDPEKAVEIISSILSNREKIDEMGAYGRKRVKLFFSPEKFSLNINAVLKEIEISQNGKT